MDDLEGNKFCKTCENLVHVATTIGKLLYNTLILKTGISRYFDKTGFPRDSHILV